MTPDAWANVEGAREGRPYAGPPDTSGIRLNRRCSRRTCVERDPEVPARCSRRTCPAGTAALVLAAALSLVGPGCAARRAPGQEPSSKATTAGTPVPIALGSSLDARFAAADGIALWTVLIEQADAQAVGPARRAGRQVLVERNADRLVLPASNMKVITLAAAATRLGWDYRFRTTLQATGTRDAHVLRGNLHVIGGADPTIGEPTGDSMATFREWAHTLRATGLRRVDGDLTGDAGRFGEAWLSDSWNVGDLPFGYGAPYSGLIFHENVVRLTVSPSSAADSDAIVTLDPIGSGLVVEASVRSSVSPPSSSVRVDREPGGHILRVTGSVAIGSAPVVRFVAAPDPAMYFLRALRTALVDEGIEIRGATRRETLAADQAATTLVDHQSAPLSEIARRFMKVSQNLYGEVFLRALGPERAESLDVSRARVLETLQVAGVRTDAIQPADGSGLSRRDFVTARALITLLHEMASEPHREAFLATLPIAGQDGTLASRFKGSPCAGRLQAKTGSLSHVRALSGYLTSASGTRYVFSIIANNYLVPTKEIDSVVDEALGLLCAS